MTPPRRVPGGDDGDERWHQMGQLWEDWQRRLPSAPRAVGGLFVLVLVRLWLAMGVYTVGPGEHGVVRRFGKAVARTGPGLHWHWPRPIERVDVVHVDAVRRVEVGFRSAPQVRLVPQESLMLTGDESIVDAQAIVQYRVHDAVAYLCRVAELDQALRDGPKSVCAVSLGGPPSKRS